MSKRARDSCGKFTAETSAPVEETPMLQKSNLWIRIKYATTLLIILIMSLPWGMILIEPAKYYGMVLGEGVGNFTMNVKDNLCGCPLRHQKPSM